jgi:hypothetical protein
MGAMWAKIHQSLMKAANGFWGLDFDDAGDLYKYNDEGVKSKYLTASEIPGGSTPKFVSDGIQYLLKDNNDGISVNFDTRSMSASYGEVLNWESSILKDVNGGTSVNWTGRALISEDGNETLDWSGNCLRFMRITDCPDNATALSWGMTAGQVYRNGDVLMIVH